MSSISGDCVHDCARADAKVGITRLRERAIAGALGAALALAGTSSSARSLEPLGDGLLAPTNIHVAVSGSQARVSWTSTDSTDLSMLVGFGEIVDGYAKVALQCISPANMKMESAGTSAKMESAGTSAKMESAGTSAKSAALCNTLLSKMESAGTSAKMESAGTSAKMESAGTSAKMESAGTSAKFSERHWGSIELVFDCAIVSGIAKSASAGSEQIFELAYDQVVGDQYAKSLCASPRFALN